MTNTTTRLKRAAIVTTLALLPMAFAGSAQAYVCKNIKTQAESLANTNLQAKKAARKFWSQKVKNSYGLEWSVYDIATSKSENCNWTGAKFYCIIRAKPCQYVVP